MRACGRQMRSFINSIGGWRLFYERAIRRCIAYILERWSWYDVTNRRAQLVRFTRAFAGTCWRGVGISLFAAHRRCAMFAYNSQTLCCRRGSAARHLALALERVVPI